MSLTKKPRVAIHSFTRIWHLILFNKGLKRAILGNFLPGQPPPDSNKMLGTNSIGSGRNSLMKRGRFFVLAAAFIVSGFFVAGLANATITSVTLTTPNGGEEWRGTQNIVWSTNGTTGDQVEISYSTDNFTSIIVLVDTVAYNGSPYAWNTSLLPDGNTYQIRVKNVAN